MRQSCHSLDALDVTFDDEHSVANAGLILAATLPSGRDRRRRCWDTGWRLLPPWAPSCAASPPAMCAGKGPLPAASG